MSPDLVRQARRLAARRARLLVLSRRPPASAAAPARQPEQAQPRS